MNKNNFKISKLETRISLQGIEDEADAALLESLPAGFYRLQPRYFIDDVELQNGQTIAMRHIEFRCCDCDKKVKKLFSGSCYPCLQSKASSDLCVTNPHRCHFLAGTCREPEWGKSFCYQPHYLYISFTDKFKIGITRESQIPFRWIDQGATAATLVAKVGSRHQAGVIEHALSEVLADKTHWQRMLKNLNTAPDFQEFSKLKKKVIAFIRERQTALTAVVPDGLIIEPIHSFFEHDTFFKIDYPLDQLPEKIATYATEKAPLEAMLTGIKGQYLIFEQGVFNMRRHEGSVVDLSLN